MTEQTITIKNRAGIHARPAALLVQTTKDFKSSIYFEKDNDRINAKSIMGIITLGAAYGTVIRIIAEGEDEKAAVETLVRLFESKFEEE
ncbi:MAG: HPr family phosphocarrier protein [Treponema sp.]|jgi:phosphocarrier protein|nr:HPr family phosphocarrier protein [Treponema sp.]MDR1278239.1 HPr family phosphocarrier protein [Treponema sp.]